MLNKLRYQEGEDKIYVPNEILVDLVNCEEIKSGSHVAFAYSYYWLISWLYRYAKYDGDKITLKDIKKALGYNENDKKVDYLVKKNGVLDQIGYTYSESDIPVFWWYKGEGLEFELLSEACDTVRENTRKVIGNNFTFKFPVKGIWRTEEDRLDCYENGTFFEIDNTHLVEYGVFEKCMNDKDLGCKGFYVYGYMKCRTQWHKGTYGSSFEKIAKELRLSKGTVMRIIHKLKDVGLLEWKSSDCQHRDGKIVQFANTYKVLI